MRYVQFILTAAAITTMRPTVADDDPRDNPKPSPFATVLDRVAAAAATNEPKKRDLPDMQLGSSVSALVDSVRKVIKNKKLENPATRDLVLIPPALDRDGSDIAHLDGGFIVTKRGKVSHAHNSVILADESVHVSHARDCLIIARGAVDVSHGRRNVIISGHFIHVSHDGNPDPEDLDGPNGSLLISGSVVDVAHAHDTIVCAPLAASISFATNVTFINTPNRYISDEGNSTYYTDESGNLPAIPPKHELIDKLTITEIIPKHDSSKGAFIATVRENIETVIRVGSAIPNATPEQKGWKLVFVGNGFALFAKDGQYASAHMVPRH